MKSLLLLLLTLTAFSSLAQNCNITISADDAMRYSTNTIHVPEACDAFTVTLTHRGKLPKNVMGHNWVLAQKENMQQVISDGLRAGLHNNYVKPADSRVIAATSVIGGGQNTSVTLDISRLEKNQEYRFFCTYPGHYSLMQGTFVIAA